MAQFVSYSGPGNTPIYYQPTMFAPGAGRFLNTGNLLGFNFTPSQTTATTSNP